MQDIKQKIDFLIGMILATYDLQVTPMLPTKFRVNWPLGSGEEAKIDLQDGHLGMPIRIILANFDLQITLMVPTKFQANWPLVQEEKQKIDFQDGGHLAFSIKTVLASFDLQVTLTLPTKSQVSWPFGSGGEAKNIFKMAVILAILDFWSEQF